MIPAFAMMLTAWAVEALFGWPDWLYRRIRHPVVWIGALIDVLDAWGNRPAVQTTLTQLALGGLTVVIVLCTSVGIAATLSAILPNTAVGFTVEAILASSLLASRSLFIHVRAVFIPLQANDLIGARNTVSQIVGRDPSRLDEAGIARAALESLSENASDGVVAPLFWGVAFGLFGLAGYKAINTMDSMIGHQTDRYRHFGTIAAKLDDVANWVPARLCGALIALAGVSRIGWRIMISDACSHRSPNAGWPEAAMAGTLGVRLSGPRVYDGKPSSNDPWLNGDAPDPSVSDLALGLGLYIKAMVCLAVLVGVAALIQGLT